MVSIDRIPSEFATSHMRDSFLQQFISQGSELEQSPPLSPAPRDALPLLGGAGGAEQLREDIPLLTRPQPKSNASVAEKISGVSEIIRLVGQSGWVACYLGPQIHAQNAKFANVSNILYTLFPA